MGIYWLSIHLIGNASRIKIVGIHNESMLCLTQYPHKTIGLEKITSIITVPNKYMQLETLFF